MTNVTNEIKKHEMNEAHKEDLDPLSFYKIRNSFDEISFKSTNRYGIYVEMPPETIQMFHLGIYDYLYQLFITELIGGTRKQFEDILKCTVVNFFTQVVNTYFPNTSNFRHRIRTRTHIQSGREKLEKVFDV